MQTFLPYPDFYDSANCLDDKRLGKQRVECKQILLALAIGGQYRYHPATKMWVGFELALAEYGKTVCEVWIDRGNEDQTVNFFTTILNSHRPYTIKFPWWFGYDAFHSAHRAALLHKNERYYSQFGWSETPALDYWWPVS